MKKLTYFIIASRWMKNNRSLERYGLLVMVIDERLFAKTLYDLTKGTDAQVYLFEQRNQLLYSDDDESLLPDMPVLSSSVFVRKEEKGEFLYAVNYSAANQFTLISRASLESFQSKSKVLLNISLVSGLAAIVMSGVLIVLFSHRMLRPVKEMVKAMRAMREGNFNVRVKPRSKDELAFLGESFNAMASNVQSLINEVYIRQLSEKDAELRAIQAQLNPHFLYNTLNGLYWKLYIQNDIESANLVSALSDLLKYSLERVDKKTTLREELHQIQHYLDLQAAFVENHFQAELIIEEGLDCVVPRLLLQPVVENAFVHAFRELASDKRLIIRAVRREHDVVIEIEDNGSGMSKEQLDRIFAADDYHDYKERKSTGLRSVIRRIDLLYGQPYRVEVSSTQGSGTTVTIRLPYEPLASVETA